jgi:hypothetical protein
MSAQSRQSAHVRGWRDFIRVTCDESKCPDPEDLKAYRAGMECARRAEAAELRFAAEQYPDDRADEEDDEP